MGFLSDVTDHGGLGGLLDDDHPQYALLAGRAGGNTFSGTITADGIISTSGVGIGTDYSLYGGTTGFEGKIKLYNGATGDLEINHANPFSGGIVFQQAGTPVLTIRLDGNILFHGTNQFLLFGAAGTELIAREAATNRLYLAVNNSWSQYWNTDGSTSIRGAIYMGGNIQTVGGSSIYATDAGDFNVFAGAGRSLFLGSNNVYNQMIINADGNVGIKRATVNASLDVKGVNGVPALNTYNAIAYFGSPITTRLGIGASGVDPYYPIWIQVSQDTEVDAHAWPLCLQPLGGALGIRTLTPTAEVHLQETKNNSLSYKVENLSNGTQAQARFWALSDVNDCIFGVAGSGNTDFGAAYSGASYFFSAAAKPMIYATNGIIRMEIETDGSLNTAMLGNGYLKVNSKKFIFGANDSAGAGYRTVSIENA